MIRAIIFGELKELTWVIWSQSYIEKRYIEMEVINMYRYSKKVIEYYEHPCNVGSFDKEDSHVGTGMIGSPSCGDVMKLQIKVSDEGVIEDACFKTYGCGSAIASSSLLTEWLKGKTLEEAKNIKNVQIAKELDLPPVKIHCSVLAEDSVKAALADYEKKHGLTSAETE